MKERELNHANNLIELDANVKRLGDKYFACN